MESLREAYIYNWIEMCYRFAGTDDMQAAGEFLDLLDKEAEELLFAESS